MKNFTYSIPTDIFFGGNAIENLGNQIIIHSKSILITYGSERVISSGLFKSITNILDLHKIEYYILSDILPNPRIDSVRKGIKICKEKNINFILAVGGGSVIDCSKAIAAGYYYNGDPWDFFIRKASLENALPIGVILTIAATGSEMNGNSVISNKETNSKLAISHELLYPKFSILDPHYTMTVSRKQTAAGTVDIMSHIFEQYFSPVQGAYVQERIAEALMQTLIHYAPISLDNPEDYEARANLMWAGKGGDWATHGIEHELSAIYDLTHGVGLAIIIPYWMRYVLDETTVDYFNMYAHNVWKIKDKNKMQAAERAILKTREFFISIGMPENLSEIGIKDEHFEVMAKKAVRFGTIGSIKVLEEKDVLKIFKMSL